MHELPDFLLPPSSKRRSSGNLVDAIDCYRPLVASWLIELSLFLGWYKVKISRFQGLLQEDDNFTFVTGISEATVEYDEEDGGLQTVVAGKRSKYSNLGCAKMLKQRLAELDQEPVQDSLSLFANIELTGTLLGLGAAEKAILSFAAVMDIFQDFKLAISTRRGKTSTQKLAQIIAHLTGQPEPEIRSGLSEESPLIAGGIVRVEAAVCDLGDKISLLDGFCSLLLQSHENEDALIGKFIRKTSPPNLMLHDFPHLRQDAEALKSYLANAQRSGEQGTNILLYGAPGTGKTEFVKALAAELGTDLYEIGFANEDGHPISGRSRLRAYNLCQRILIRKNNAILMFDEIEDVFSQGGMVRFAGLAGEDEGGNRPGKAWMNRMLERNATPAIWVTNDADIDPAYLRRFDYSIHFPIPPQQVRLSIARHHLGQFNPPEDWLVRIAANEAMTPGQYERAAKVARISCGGDSIQACALVEQVLERSATLLGQKRIPARNIRHTGYDVRFINTSLDVHKIITGLKNKSRGTFCFYGPAGTGKSEFARHIADEIGMPLLVRRASDILSMWLGESEKNIARMFADARQQGAVLVLDEADSFLTDRREARHSWEVTQVNELLTQMEAFEGVFVCTTNLMEKLDPASLRRFAFKIKFDYLTADQRWLMFLKEFTRLGGGLEAASDWEKPVRGLDKLTPGDFAVAARQFDVMDVPVTSGELFRQLQEECKVKGGTTSRMGFVL